MLVGLAVAGLATWRLWERQIPGGRPTVAVADFTNETGDPELASISGLLITSLEQGTQLRVLTRGRMLDVLKQLGRGDVQRIDEPLAREVGRATRANALLLASVRKLGEAYVVEMRALDPLHDEYVFTASDRATGKAAISDVIDRLGASPGAFQVRHLISRGRAPEAEALLRKAIAGHTDGPAPPRNWESHYTGLAEALAAQGRLAEARRVVAEHARLVRARDGKPPDAGRQVEWNRRLGVAARSPAVVRAAVGESEPDTMVQESLRAETVHELAHAGDIAGAGSLAASMRRELGPGWSKRCTPIYAWDAAPKRCDVLAALGEGRAEEAERDLRAVAEAAWLTDRFAAAFLLGELARARGDCSAAVRWTEQALAVKSDLGSMSFRAHVDPGMLQILAGCYEKLGEVQKARERNERFLHLWANADPDIPLLADAKAMQARLAPIGSPSR